MPELPEVETIRRDLEKLLLGKTIRQIEVRDLSVIHGISPTGGPLHKITLSRFKGTAIGKQISTFNRRGKYLAMEFSDGTALVFHLRMTGQILVGPPAVPERIRFDFDQGHRLYFSDRRRFGEVVFSENWKEEPSIASLGVEPMNGALSGEYLKSAFRGRSAPVHSILLSQKHVSGLGNIYVTEALYEAGILPTRPCGRIPLGKLSELSDSIRHVIADSIENRGYSMNTYVDALGKKGRSQMFSKAYGKGGLPCPNCGTLFKRKVIAGRGVVFCPKCQK